MAIPLTINGATFEYPENFDENWGVEATGWAQAVTNGMLQMSGGSFPITADINFGPNFGLLSKYFETRSSNPATAGTVRLSSADAGIAWRNNANSGNLILTTNASDQLLFNGSPIGGGVSTVSGTTNQINSTGGTTPVLSLSSTLVFPGTATGTLTGHSTLDLALTGGTMSGTIAMGANKITGLANGTASTDAAAFGQIPTFTTWTAYTPTILGFGTVGNVSFYWRQEGNDQIHVRGTFQAGTLAATATSISIPSGTIAFSKMPSSIAKSTLVGTFVAIRTADFSPTTIVAVSSDVSSTAVFMAIKGTAGSGLTVATGQNLGDDSDYYMTDFSYAI